MSTGPTSSPGQLPSGAPRVAAEVLVRSAAEGDREFVRDELARNWGGVRIWSLGRAFEADRLPGLVAVVGGERVGLVTYDVNPGGFQCEVVTLSTRVEGRGVGARLLAGAVVEAGRAGCARVFLTTTNDNLRAIGFYQLQGWRLAAVHMGAMDEARRRGTAIPVMGKNGIPIRDEIEFELRL